MLSNTFPPKILDEVLCTDFSECFLRVLEYEKKTINASYIWFH